jgi:1,2-diacylglycerol 3-alpha-glucosyltransferase
MRLYRVGLFTDVYLPNPNGVSTSVYLLLRELRRMGHEAWVIAPALPGVEEEEGVVRVWSVSYPFFEGVRVAMPSPRLLPTHFEIIHTHTPLTLGLWGLRLATQRHLPHVSTFHTNYEKYARYIPGLAVLDRYTGLVQRLGRAFYNRAEVVIAPTPPVEELALSYQIVRPIRVVPSGIDIELLEAAPLPPSPWPAGTRRLLSVGRLGKEKSFDILLQAFYRIRQEAEAHLVIIGEGPERLALEALARELGIREQVSFLGALPYQAIGGYYRLAELFLFASATETQGLVLWEAQALGVPVVAVGALGTLAGVEVGQTGFLVPPEDPEALAAHALLLLRDEELRQSFSAKARSFASARSARRVAEEIVQVYDEAQELLNVEPRRLRIPFPRLPGSSPPSSPEGF